MDYQKTIRKPVSCSGIGLHSGKRVNLKLCPALADSGIVFQRIDLPGKPEIAARVENLVEVNHATTLCKDGAQVQTVEHLMAAFAGLGIDNILVQLDSGEVPIMDGSAAPFIYLLHEAEVLAQSQPRYYLKVNQPVKVEYGDKFVVIYPADEFKVSYFLDFNHPLIRNQHASVICDEETFISKICRARTFGFLEEVELLRKHGLAKGGSLDNAIVIGQYDILNDSLRFEDEFVYHKIMDSVGDLYLLGKPILGHFVGHKAGHALHTQLACRLAQEPGKLSLVNGLEYRRKMAKSADYHPAIQSVHTDQNPIIQPAYA